MNLVALYSIFLDGRRARRAGLEALRLHPEKGAAFKRAAAAFLPAKRLRTRLWGAKLDAVAVDEAEGRRLIGEQAPLVFGH